MTARFTRSERWILLALAAVQFTNIVDFMIVMPLGPQFIRELGISESQFGWAISAYAFAAGTAGLLAALGIDRFDRRPVLLWLYAALGLATLACGLAPNYPTLLLARIAAGVAGGLAGAIVFAIVGDLFGEERRGSATGLVMAAFGLATVVGVPAGLFASELLHNWRAPFLGLAAFTLPVWVLVARVLPPVRGHLISADSFSEATDLFAVLTRPSHLWAYGMVVLLMLAGFTVIPFIAVYLDHNVGVNGLRLLAVYLAGGVATLITMPLIGRWSDRSGKPYVFRLVAAASVVPLLLVTHLPRVPLWEAVAATTLFMVLMSGRSIPAISLATSSARPEVRGRFLSLFASVQQAAMGVAALITGQLLHTTADGQLHNFSLAGLIATAATLASILWMRGARVVS